MALHLFAPFARFRLVVLLTAFIGLAACGGGGDDAPVPISYTGATGAAAITTEGDAKELSTSSYEMGNASASGASPTGVVQTGGTEAQATQRALAIADKIRSITAATQTSASPMGISGTEAGPCGGTVTYSFADDMSSGSMSFLNYCDSGGTLAGTVNFLFDMGTGRIDLVMNLNVRDNASGLIYKLENYQVAVVDYGAYVEMTIATGSRFYHPQYGYVSVSTPVPLRIYPDGYWPYMGEIVVTTDNTSSTHRGCRLVASTTTYTIYYDDDGDGNFDNGSITGNWADL